MPVCIVCKRTITKSEVDDCEKEGTFGYYCSFCLKYLITGRIQKTEKKVTK